MIKMKLVIVFLGLVIGALASNKAADKDLLLKQKEILELFKYINNVSYNKEYIDIANNFKIETYASKYKPEAYEEFMYFWKQGCLKRGEIFSIFNDKHMKEARALFKLFYYAQDYDTFYKTAIWARQNMNEGMFLYSCSVAVVYRDDTYGIVLPPIYEIYPHYFFSTEVMQKANKYKQTYATSQYKDQSGNYKKFTIYSNYSGHYLNLNPEQGMSYYLEDVGINSFYFYYNIRYPYWIDGKEFKLKNDCRGENFYFIHQQILARYYLERLSNGYDQIEYLDWNVPFETGYYPSLQYPNGLEFPERPHFANLKEYFRNYGQKWCWNSRYGYSYLNVRDYERRIRDAIDFGYVFDKNMQKIDLFGKYGFEVLANIIEGNVDSPHKKYYGEYISFARHLLGYSKQPLDSHKLAPSALEHYSTSLRDPAFYALFKRVTLLFQKYKTHLPSYNKTDLHWDNVKISKVEIDPLVTYFDHFYADITNGLYVTPEEYQTDPMHVRVHQYRLNHKTFNYNIHVDSNAATKATVKVFIGPKYDAYGRTININENRMNFVLWDHFVYDLKSGSNEIKRSSQDSKYYVPDRTSYYDLYKKVMSAYNGQEEFIVNGKEAYYGYPQRYMLPKGTKGGKTYQLYVMIYPYVPYEHKQQVDIEKYYYPKMGAGMTHVDNYPLGYPFDRLVKESCFQHMPNGYFMDVKIYHESYDKMNAVHTEDDEMMAHWQDHINFTSN